ncbi:MAG: trypsin-like serine peptidase [Planctomycetaceae bacterium]
MKYPTPVDARLWPYVCSLQMIFPQTAPGHFAVGSGCLIGRRTVLTAGHNVYDCWRGGKVLSVDVVFGDGDRIPVPAVEVDTTQQWIDTSCDRDPLSPFDFGVVVLPDFDHETDPLPVVPADDGDLSGVPLNVAGYPATPPPPHTLGTLFGARAPAELDAAHPARIFYAINTWDGMSGGPTYTFDSATQTRTVRGVHTSSVGRGSALRITTDVTAVVDEWLQLFEP